MIRTQTTVQITFRTPPRTNVPRSSTIHRRCLENVPRSTAQKMAEDFAAYQAERSRADRQKTYTYQPAGDESASDDEAFIALDFGEIVALHADGEEVSSTTKNGQALA